jgi:hypothetical protein
MKTYLQSALCIASSLLVLAAHLPASAADAKQPTKDSPRKAELEKIRGEQNVKKGEVLQAAKELAAALVGGNIAAVDRMLARDYVEVYEEDVMMWDGRRIHLPPTPKKVPGKNRTKDEILSGAGT